MSRYFLAKLPALGYATYFVAPTEKVVASSIPTVTVYNFDVTNTDVFTVNKGIHEMS